MNVLPELQFEKYGSDASLSVSQMKIMMICARLVLAADFEVDAWNPRLFLGLQVGDVGIFFTYMHVAHARLC